MNCSKRNRIFTPLRIFSSAILLIVVGCYFLPDAVLFDKLDAEANRKMRRIGEEISRRHDLHMLLTFDETPPVESISNTPFLQSGVQSVPGRFGNARYFDGRVRTFLATQTNWADLGNQFTVSLWLKMDGRSANQKIMYAAAHDGEIGLRLLHGDLTFYVPRNNAPLSYPFSRFGEFVHIAVVADETKGFAAIYENGQERARIHVDSVQPSWHNVVFSMNRWSHSHTPFIGMIDEVSLWKRALSSAEIAALSQRNRSLLPALSPVRHMVARMFVGLRRSVRAGFVMADALNVFLHPGRAAGADLPELNIYLSKRDVRHFLTGDSLRTSSGYLVRDAAQPRKIEYYYNGVSGTGHLQLYGDEPGRAGNDVRMGFLFSTDDVSPPFGLRRVRLSPPEDTRFLEPLFATELARTLEVPYLTNGLFRLKINGEFRGIYYFEDYESMGIFPGQGGSLHWGTRHPANWLSLFNHADDVPFVSLAPLVHEIALTKPELHEIYDNLEQRYARILINDPYSPLSSREARYIMKLFRRDMHNHIVAVPDDESRVTHVMAQLREHLFLGDNPSPFFLVKDLHLDAFSVPDITITWNSETPDILKDDGTVIRPAGRSAPKDAYLRAVISDGTSTGETTLRFRVMPEILEIPVVMLHANTQLSRRRRVDALAYYHPAESAGTEPVVLTATSWSGGGISHRGNTSHWEQKKPFNFRSDTPHRLLNDSGSRHLLFSQGSRDNTRMRNFLSYELFRAFSSPSSPRYAPDLDWVEVFFNGEYIGLYEMKSRMDRRTLGFPAYRAEEEHPAQLFKVSGQKYPTSRHGDFLQDYEQARYALRQKESPDDAFNTLASHIDVANAVDYHLLLNIIEGTDNMTANYFLARWPGVDEKFHYVAWDMKRTFRGGDRNYTHHLSARAAHSDAFQDLVRKRWLSVRDTHASDENILQQIDELEMRLTAYMSWEFERWGYNDNQQYERFVSELRHNIVRRLAVLDERYGVTASDP